MGRETMVILKESVGKYPVALEGSELKHLVSERRGDDTESRHCGIHAHRVPPGVLEKLLLSDRLLALGYPGSHLLHDLAERLQEGR